MKNYNFEIDKNQSNYLFEHVITYAELGWSIIPMMESAGQKIPYVKWGKWQKQRPSIEQLNKWWTKNPNANIGVVTGPISNIIVLDFDTRNARNEFKLQRLLGETAEVETARGYHYYYQYPSGLILPKRKVLADNVELLGGI